jgi:hypothetical protein
VIRHAGRLVEELRAPQPELVDDHDVPIGEEPEEAVLQDDTQLTQVFEPARVALVELRHSPQTCIHHQDMLFPAPISPSTNALFLSLGLNLMDSYRRRLRNSSSPVACGCSRALHQGTAIAMNQVKQSVSSKFRQASERPNPRSDAAPLVEAWLAMYALLTESA